MTMNKHNPFFLLWRISRGGRALYLAGFIFMFLSVCCSFLLPQTIRFVVDSVVGGLSASDVPVVPRLLGLLGPRTGPGALKEGLWLAGLLAVALSAVGGLFNFGHHICLSKSSEGMIKRLRDTLYSHIQRLPYRWHIEIQTGDIIQRCTSDVEVVRGFVSAQITEIVRAAGLIIFAYSFLFPINRPMAVTSLAFLPVIFAYSSVFLRSAADRFLAADEAEGKLLTIAQENFTGVRVVRAFGRERYELDKFDAQNRRYAALWMRLGKILSAYWGVGDLLTGLQMVALCAVGAHQASAGGVTVGEFMVFLSYNSMIIWPVRGLGRVLSEASKASVSLGRIREILDAPTETDALPDGDDETALPVRGDIAFRDVSFSYGAALVLRDISFTIRGGTTFGILGATGAGKTTLAYLICRLYDLEPGNGEITIGGVDIRRLDRRQLRRHIGIVLQEPFLYSRTIKDNIASLRDGIPFHRVREAAAVSQVDGAINAFASGYDTVVGERGVTLSGGQKQRVAIARAILREPQILIFDDSLSAVDTETDSRIRAALARRLAQTDKATTIIIAHRITSVSGADVIMVMDEGRIVEMGTPQELLARGGVYRRIYDMQQSVVADAGGSGDDGV
ncbi:MAG: ABC transporter ATP-binding protein/permease [Synergistaceae bacterium]|jgi:ATP-binding cassette subfamily B protein|nr:ABC transporter ATP-binding protein/permease [Synergistaceae bacterium]